MHPFAQDLRHGCRSLLKAPGFTLVAIATLALALGANTAIFTFVNSILLEPMPYPDADRIVRVLEKRPDGGRNGISTLNYLDWQKENTCFSALAARNGGSVSLTGVAEPVLLPGDRVSARYFDIFGIKPALGRAFVDGEDQAGKDHVVILSDTLWRTQFGADPALVGRAIQLDGESYTVIGVMPAGTPFERGYARLWRPLTFKPDNMTRNFHWFGAMAKLKPGVTLEQARAQLDTIGQRIAKDYPDSNKGWSVAVDLRSEVVVGPELRQSLYVLLAAVGMVLLIACANLANLSLMRVVGREREIAIRIALGAGRWRLLRQFLTESLLVSLAGGIAGVLLGRASVGLLLASMPSYTFPPEAHVALDGRVLTFSFLLAVLTGLAIGLFPAFQAARPSLTNALKQGGTGASAGSHARVRNGLVVAEVALAFMLLTGAGLLMRSLFKISAVDPGFDAQNVLTFRLPVAQTQYPDPVGFLSYLEQIRTRLRALPGVADVALTSSLPMQGWGYGMPYQIAGAKTVDRANRRAAFFKMVSPSYFPSLHMRLVRGRFLADTDRPGAPHVTVINETMARKNFPDTNPIGQRILVQEIVPGKTQLGDEIPWEVVGVVADEAVGSLDEKPDDNPGMYVPVAQSPAYYISIVLKGAADTALLREPVKKAVRALNADQVLAEMKTLDTIRDESLGSTRVRMVLLATFAGISLLLAALGIYGVISYAVTQRTRELGIRSALGASQGRILQLVLRDGMGLAVLGLVLGVAGAFGLTRLMQSLLFGIQDRDPVTLVTVFALLAAVALIACLLPARRAARVDPLVALRCE